LKYTTFRNLLLVGGACVVVGAGAYACSRSTSGSSASGLPSSSASSPAPTAPATVLVVTPPDPSPAAPVTSAPASATIASSNGLRPVDRDILAWRKTATMTGDKAKDVFPGKPYKVDGYKDEGKTGVSRVKVDLDRDGKWDEKWDFDGDKVKRKVAPADDENYQQEFRLEGEAWRVKN
jgi:hypothetical protein